MKAKREQVTRSRREIENNPDSELEKWTCLTRIALMDWWTDWIKRMWWYYITWSIKLCTLHEVAYTCNEVVISCLFSANKCEICRMWHLFKYSCMNFHGPRK